MKSPAEAVNFFTRATTLDRYLAQGFLRIFVNSLIGVTGLFLIVEFFDNIGTFIATGAPLGTAIRYFIYKLPLSISRVIGFATLFSVLFSLSTLARTNEITAMRAGGLSLYRISLPLLVLSLLICGFTFVWNEALVPPFTHEAQTIYKTEIKQKRQKSLLGTRDIWIRGEGSLINIDYFDRRNSTLQGVTIFLLNPNFSFRGLIEIPEARWIGGRWVAQGGTQWHFLGDGKMTKEATSVSPPILETPEDLKLLARDPEEFTFFELKKQITDLKARGIDATTQEVDLQVKAVLPFISPLMVLLGVAFALKRHLSGGIALSFGIAMLIAFGYWVLLAFCISLGHSGALPPWLAAWIPNTVFVMIGLFFFTGEE